MAAAVEKDGLRPTARAVDVSYTAVSSFVSGATPQEDTLEKYEAWAGEQNGRNGGKVREKPAGYRAGLLEEVGGSGEMSDVERLYVEELRRIAGLDQPEAMKIMARDSLASSISRLGNIIADRAAEARARAIEKAESASESRAKAIERAEESADLRVRALTGEAPGGVGPLSPEELGWILERRRRRQDPGAEEATGS